MRPCLRLQTIASLVPQGARVCDIGTDHGYLPVFLMQNGIAAKVIATDLREKPLENARKNLQKFAVQGVETRLCDGLSGVAPHEADTVVIAGMGGEVIRDIIMRCAWLTEEPAAALILQPTTSPEVLRRFLTENGFAILREIPLEENGKAYSVLLSRYCGKKTDPGEAFFFVGLVSPDSAAGRAYIEKQYRRVQKCAEALENNPAEQEKAGYYRRLAQEIAQSAKL